MEYEKYVIEVNKYNDPFGFTLIYWNSKARTSEKVVSTRIMEWNLWSDNYVRHHLEEIAGWN